MITGIKLDLLTVGPVGPVSPRGPENPGRPCKQNIIPLIYSKINKDYWGQSTKKVMRTLHNLTTIQKGLLQKKQQNILVKYAGATQEYIPAYKQLSD